MSEERRFQVRMTLFRGVMVWDSVKHVDCEWFEELSDAEVFREHLEEETELLAATEKAGERG